MSDLEAPEPEVAESVAAESVASEAVTADVVAAEAELVADPVLLASRAQAREALAEVTDAASIGADDGYEINDAHVLTLFFECRLEGYPGWRWAASLTRVDDESPVTVLEVELLPGAGAVVAPEWVPWSVRLAQYREAQAQARQAREAEGSGASEGSGDGDHSADGDHDDEHDVDALLAHGLNTLDFDADELDDEDDIEDEFDEFADDDESEDLDDADEDSDLDEDSELDLTEDDESEDDDSDDESDEDDDDSDDA